MALQTFGMYLKRKLMSEEMRYGLRKNNKKFLHLPE